MSERSLIPVAAPTLDGNEQRYVMDCLQTSWISSTGKYVERFEADFARFCGVKHAVALSNGTTALHVALLALHLQPGDEVIVPTLTFVATANAVAYCQATPVVVDAEPRTWGIDPALIEQQVTPRTRGIIVVHLFGHPVDMDPIHEIARRHGLWVLEDAAQAHGAEYRGRRTGSLATAATFSFFGNKIISTGEGGMFTTDDPALAERVRLLKSHGMDPNRRYWHPVMGYNYRMTNVAAAIGVAQLERVEHQLARRREVVSWYRQNLTGAIDLSWQSEEPWGRHAWWMFTAILGDSLPIERDELIRRMRDDAIETRPVVFPMHQLPMYQRGATGRGFPVADRLARRGINLPTWAGVSRSDVDYICDRLASHLKITQMV